MVQTVGAKIDNVIGGLTQGKRAEIQSTVDRISQGGSFPHRNDWSIFRNDQNLLPTKSEGYYTEYVHPTNGELGAERIVMGQEGEIYYTPDHYDSFTEIIN